MKINPLHIALKKLAVLDFDKAREKNDIGFNKKDSEYGHFLANKDSLSVADQKQAKAMLKKYNVQLGPELYDQVLNFEIEIPEIAPPTEDKDPNDIHVVISEKDHVSGLIRNGKEAKIDWVQFNEPKTIVRFNGKIESVIKIDERDYGLRFIVDDKEYSMNLHDASTFFRINFSLNTVQVAELIQVLSAFISSEVANGQCTPYSTSPIFMVEDKIKVAYEGNSDTRAALRLLRDFYPDASNENAFLSIFAWSLLSPLHSELKSRSSRIIQTPLVLETGKTKSGKTELGAIFIGKGFNLDKDSYFFPYNRVKTPFTLMKHLSESNLPCLFDDIPVTWIGGNKEDLKAYVQTGHFGDRGKSDQTLREYKGERSFILTINDDVRIDDDLAFALRLIILRFGEEHKVRMNLKRYNEFFEQIPAGFLLQLFKELYEGQDINEILRTVEKFESVDEWISYAVNQINELCKKYDIEPYPILKENVSNSTYVSNALEIAQSFIAEWETIKRNTESRTDEAGEPITFVKYRSPIEDGFKVEETIERFQVKENGTSIKMEQRVYHIHFTSGAFKMLVQRYSLRVPYANATNFMNNIIADGIISPENNGELKSVRIGNQTPKAFTILYREEPEKEVTWS